MLKMLMAAGLVAVMALAACNDPIEPKQDSIEVYPQVHLTSYWLRENIVVQPPVVERVGNGQLKVTIPVRTLTDNDLSLDYQYHFMGKNGVQTEPTSSWQFIRIPRKGIEQIQFTSMSPADDFRVEIRYRK